MVETGSVTVGFVIIIVYFVFAIGVCVIWGVVTNKVIENKGYSENWFWWGFFFGLIALIVALTKPDVKNTQSGNNPAFSALTEDNELDNLKKLKEYKELLDSGVITQEEFEKKKERLMNN